jgi:hypothetical protein
MKKADLVGGCAGIMLGAYVLYEGSKMPPDHIMKIGPSFFPGMLASGLILFSSILIIYALLGHSKGKAEAISFSSTGIQRALVALLAIIAYAVLLVPLGYPLSTLLLVGGIMRLLGKREPMQLALVSLGTTFCVWLIFAKLLKLSMPLGVLENLF